MQFEHGLSIAFVFFLKFQMDLRWKQSTPSSHGLKPHIAHESAILWV